jgi:MFS family permease
LYAAASVLGIGIGSGMTAAYTAGGAVLPVDARGTGFGFLTSASLAGLAISPMAAGVLGRTSIAAVFVFDAIVLAVVGLAVSRLMASRTARTESPVAEEI